MTPEQIIATVSALLAGEPDPAFDLLRNGGYDARYPVVVEDCPRPIISQEVEVEGRTMLCGKVTVPESHDADNGNTIPLAFVILKSRSAAPAPDPVMYLHGGPGGFVLQDIGTTSFVFDFARDRRDIISFDQRGAGLSNRTVACFNEFAEDFVEFAKPSEDFYSPDGPLARCLAEVQESGVELNLYNTTENAKDVRAIMSALGYAEYNVYGISYGTKLAQEVMRSAPHQVRSVVLDSISRVDNPAYDSNGVPLDQALGWVVDLCAADPQCAEAYPDLEATINSAAERLMSEPMTILGEERDETYINAVMEAGNKDRSGPFMAYLPKAFSDLAAGDVSTIETLMSGGFAPRPVTPDSLTQAYPDLTAQDKAMAEAVVMQANQMTLTEQAALKLLAALADDLSTAGAATTEQLLDDELSAILTSMETDDVLAMTRDYVRLGDRQPDKEHILAFVDVHVPYAFQARIRSLVEAMNDEDVAAFHRRASLDSSRITNAARTQFALTVYACQEDFPFNSREGYEAFAQQYRFPFIDRAARESTFPLYGICDLFEKFPREGFHDPVVSDIPVLATAGTKDTQTNPDAAEIVSRTLGNAQYYLYPETGHAVTIFSKCANDMADAFIEDPTAKVNDDCIADLKPRFLLPDGTLSGG